MAAPSGEKKKKLFFVIGIVGLMVVAGGIGIGVRWLQQQNAGSQTTQEKTPLEKTQATMIAGDFEAAHKSINDQLSRSDISSDERYDWLFQQGSTYYNEEEWQKAMDSFKEAAKIKETSALYEFMSFNAEMLQDYKGVVEYTKKAIELIPPDYPRHEADKASYEVRIKEFEAKL